MKLTVVLSLRVEVVVGKGIMLTPGAAGFKLKSGWHRYMACRVDGP
jgi:hypothetical protein